MTFQVDAATVQRVSMSDFHDFFGKVVYWNSPEDLREKVLDTLDSRSDSVIENQVLFWLFPIEESVGIFQQKLNRIRTVHGEQWSTIMGKVKGGYRCLSDLLSGEDLWITLETLKRSDNIPDDGAQDPEGSCNWCCVM